MDFATLKAYMTSASYKENANTTTACVQKRLNVNKVERKTNRNFRLSQLRKIPDNMSACNTPQVKRTVHPLDITKPSVNNTTSKLYEDKQKMRLQRLREFKEKREKLKREEAANKKPLFKVTHASVEKYDLEKIYNNIKGMPILPSNGPYKFLAPQNVQALSFLKNTAMKTQESPKKRVTRSTTRLQTNALKEVKPEIAVNRMIENATNQSKLNRNASKHAFEDGRSKDIHQKLNSPRNSRKPNKNQSMNQYTDNTPVAPRSVDKTTKSRLRATKPEEISSRTNLFEAPKHVIETSDNIANTETMISNSNLTFKGEKSKIIITPFRVAVKITRAEQMLADSSLPSTLFEESHTLSDKNKEAEAEKKITRQSTKIPVKTPSKVEVNQPITPAGAQKKERTQAKINAQFNVEDVLSDDESDIFLKTPSKMETNVQDIAAKTPRLIRKFKLEEILEVSPLKTRNFVKKSMSTVNDDETTSKKLKMKRTLKTNYKCNVEEVHGDEKDLKSKFSHTKSSEKLKTNKSERRLRSKSTDVHQEEELVKSSLKWKKIKNRTTSKVKKSPSKPNADIKSEIESQSPNTSRKPMVKSPAKKTLLKKLESFSKDVVEDSVVNNIENNVNEANTAKWSLFVKTPENVAGNSNLGGEPGEICVYISPFVTVSRGKQRARDEYAQRQNAGGTINSPALQQSTSVKTAAEFFTLLLNKETTKINNSCDYWNTFKNENNLPEEAVDMIDVASGQGTLLKNKKMESFRNLIQYSLEEQTDKPVTCMDLHGYWDVLNMQIENVSTRFENLLKLRDNNWKEILPEKPKKITTAKKVSKPLANTKRSNALREAIKSARLRSKAQSSDVSSDANRKTPTSDRRSKNNSISSAKGSHKPISALIKIPRKSISSPRSSSPHIMMQVSQVAKSVDRLGSEAVLSAKSILKKRQKFKEFGRKPKVVLFDVSDDVIGDYVSAQDHDDITAKESPFVRRSTRLQ